MLENYKQLTTEQSLYIIENCVSIKYMFCNMNACYVPNDVDVESLIHDHNLDDSYVFVKSSEYS